MAANPTTAAMADGLLTTTSQTTIFTGSANHAYILKEIHVCNAHTSVVTLTVELNRTGTDRRYCQVTLDPGDYGNILDANQVTTLEAGDIVKMTASVANVITYFLSGADEDVT